MQTFECGNCSWQGNKSHLIFSSAKSTLNCPVCNTEILEVEQEEIEVEETEEAYA